MIDDLRKKFIESLDKAGDSKTLEDLRVKFLGRKGELTKIFNEIKVMAAQEKVKLGQLANELRAEIEENLKKKTLEIREGGQKVKEWLDVTAPGLMQPRGYLHPRTQLMRKIENIFISLGFSVVSGPELETQWYNFEALNIPKDHPARDMQDTFYVKNPDGKDDLVLRTHTSNMQVRFMEKNNPPLRIIVPGKVFRNEATDASHNAQFYQLEGLMVDKNISVANFKAIMAEFFSRFFGQKIKMRFRPSFFPFTEPSFEIDVGCTICNQKGCKVCRGTGWLEVAPGGMVNQKVFEAVGYARNEWQGFAFGLGFDRMVMMKYQIDDIRLLTGGDIGFLRQF